MDIFVPLVMKAERRPATWSRSKSRGGRRPPAGPSAVWPSAGQHRRSRRRHEIIIRKYGIADAHSPEAIAEAVGWARRSPKRTSGAHRFPAGAHGHDRWRARARLRRRDHDREAAERNYWLGVHIADVSHYVQEGSALDREGYDRGTSVYFPERAVHMFPSELATGLCSLNPHVDRLVQSCLMEVDPPLVSSYVMSCTTASSQQRADDVHAVNGILTDNDPRLLAQYRPLVPMFELMRELFVILNDARRRRGSIDFDLHEAEVVIDEGGVVEAIIALHRNVRHRLIEEFMLLANETVASYLDAQSAPALYRVHEEPDVMKISKFEDFISGFGYSLGAPLTA